MGYMVEIIPEMFEEKERKCPADSGLELPSDFKEWENKSINLDGIAKGCRVGGNML